MRPLTSCSLVGTLSLGHWCACIQRHLVHVSNHSKCFFLQPLGSSLFSVSCCPCRTKHMHQVRSFSQDCHNREMRMESAGALVL